MQLIDSHLQLWLILQQVVAASGKVANGYLKAASTICSKATSNISCKLP